MNKPTEEQINNVLNECADNIMDGHSKYPGMTYEQGVESAIQWLLGDSEYNPMD